MNYHRRFMCFPLILAGLLTACANIDTGDRDDADDDATANLAAEQGQVTTAYCLCAAGRVGAWSIFPTTNAQSYNKYTVAPGNNATYASASDMCDVVFAGYAQGQQSCPAIGGSSWVGDASSTGFAANHQFNCVDEAGLSNCSVYAACL